MMKNVETGNDFLNEETTMVKRVQQQVSTAADILTGPNAPLEKSTPRTRGIPDPVRKTITDKFKARGVTPTEEQICSVYRQAIMRGGK